MSNSHRINLNNYKENINEMRDLSYEIVNELIKPYEDQIKVDLYDD